ncbi:hypothetical protein [Pseudomonas amygdali]|uniref:Uncharacterized protein n=2 Tax=Pseudomonas amygdali pv. lachrymans TaxID=53707 RepID=A0ABR5KTC5_PSEAV|nr:hypothetical protein [Pseudomonas amygdali]AXH59503.1 hypothetical protein PLA107_030210 [Pseudomonas amygdali pv. lachrymans str. M301315]KPC16930.1 Uncharacterized protein AC499_0132 [Pseudomonas amygdali pv. lachrymans]KPC17889.1 Uncharacterized protein AC499_1091 [Pseudomonas amygdali pv. lachrymans]RMT06195.1 hypothetical protein ALP54_03430 [Pseudomonas amygdali pv. lachrymans]
MSQNNLTDPFDDVDNLEQFDMLDDDHGQFKDSDDSELVDDSSDLSLSDDDADLGQPAPAQAPAKPAKVAATADQPKAFVKTPLGIACIAGCVVMLGIVGVGASGVFSSSAPVEIAEQADIPAPSEPNAFGNKAGLAPSKPIAAAEPIQAASAVREVQEAQQKNAQFPNPVLQAIPDRTAMAPGIPVSQPLAQQPAIAPASNELSELKSSIADLQVQTKAITGLVKDVSGMLERSNRRQDELMAQVQSLKADIAKIAATPAPAAPVVAQPAVAAKAQAATAAAPAKPASITDGRTRLAGLQVIDTSQNGDMSIIKKASNGRIFTLYPDEVINWAGNRQKVTGIEKDGSIVLVGEKFYIDKVLEAPKAEPKPEPKPARPQVSLTRRDTAPSAPVSARGFTLNAVYDGNNSFGVVNDKGEFKSYKKGDTIDKLGAVKGLTPDGDLEVGNTIIKSVY